MSSPLMKRSTLLLLHNKSHHLQQKNQLKWFDISLLFIQQIEHNMATWIYEISLFALKTESEYNI